MLLLQAKFTVTEVRPDEKLRPDEQTWWIECEGIGYENPHLSCTLVYISPLRKNLTFNPLSGRAGTDAPFLFSFCFGRRIQS